MARISKTLALLLVAFGGGYAAAGGAGVTHLTEGIRDIVQVADPALPAREGGDPWTRIRSDEAGLPATGLTLATGSEPRALSARAHDPRPDRMFSAPELLALPRIAEAREADGDASPPTAPRHLAQAGTTSTDTERGAGAAPGERLTRAIQAELRRVGCYTGDVDGDWGPATRRAMQAFNDRVNASLPIAQPDYILLTLLQGHAARACGAACPYGQAQSEDGACLPRSVIAERRRRAVHGDVPPVTVQRNAVSAMARGGAAAPAEARVDEPSSTSVRAESERRRIAAAEARRQERAAEAEARAAAERVERLAAAENARVAAEARRRQELTALAVRAQQAAKQKVAANRPTSHQGAVTTGSVPGSVASTVTVEPTTDRARVVSPVPLPPMVAQAAPEASSRPLRPRARKAAQRTRGKPRHVRYAGRVVPSQIYRVGRLPPRVFRAPMVLSFVARPRMRARHNPQAIFRELGHRMP